MKSQDEHEWLPSMLTQDETKLIKRVYDHLIGGENRGWDSLDEYLEFLEYLNDEELHREADVLKHMHKNCFVRCQKDHPVENCFIPLIVQAAAIIIDIYTESGYLHERNRYILEYYLAMQQADMIVAEKH